MLVDNNIVFSFLTCCVVFKYSKQQKPGECKPCDNGQYWSRSLISMCMACPKILKVCGDQGVDEQCCFDSCRKPEKTSTTAKMTSTTAEMTSTATEIASATAEMASTTAEMISSTAETTSTTAESEMTSSTAEMTSTTAEMTSTTAEMTSTTAEMTSSTAEMTSTTAEMTSSTAEMTSTTAALSTKGVFTSAVEKPTAHVNYFNWELLATVIVLCVLVSVALLLLLKLYLYVRKHFSQAGKTGEEERIALQNLAIQVTDQDSSTRFGGIQDTEVSNGTSVLNLSEIHS